MHQISQDELLYQRGQQLRREGRWEEAMTCFMQAVEINPQSPAREIVRMEQSIMEFKDHNMFNH